MLRHASVLLLATSVSMPMPSVGGVACTLSTRVEAVVIVGRRRRRRRPRDRADARRRPRLEVQGYELAQTPE